MDDTRKRIFRAVKRHFASAGFVVFDESLDPKPQVLGPNQQAWWGGYEFNFKLIEEAKYKALGGGLEALRRNALVVGPEQQRKFSVDMSKFEYCEGKVEREIDSYSIYVYSPEMIVVEKLRAICQQMPEYAPRSRPSPRARDFYDIWRVMTATSLDLTAPEIAELAKHIFAAKQRPPGAACQGERSARGPQARLAGSCGGDCRDSERLRFLLRFRGRTGGGAKNPLGRIAASPHRTRSAAYRGRGKNRTPARASSGGYTASRRTRRAACRSRWPDGRGKRSQAF